MASCCDTHLIAEHSNAACGRNLVRSEPNGSQFSRKGKNEHLRNRHNRLTDESDVEEVGMDSQNLHPRSEACPQTSENGGNS